MRQIGRWIAEALNNRTDAAVLGKHSPRGAGTRGRVPAVCGAEGASARGCAGVTTTQSSGYLISR